jgi:hypothetical protein
MKVILIAMVAAMFAMGCRHHSMGFRAYFCTTSLKADKHYLYIDNVKQGVLPVVESVPEVDQAYNNDGILFAALTGGKHTVEVKDSGGKVIFSEVLKVRRVAGSASVSSIVKNPAWDTRVKVKDDQLVLALIY